VTLLAFDASAHRYTHNGRPLLSVTQVITEAGLIDAAWFTDEARDRGSYVHEAIALGADLDLETLDDRLRPYLEAHRTFVRDTGFVAELVEHRVCDPVLGYAGTLDAFGAMGAIRAIVDYKTGPAPAWGGLQLAAYLRCLPSRYGVRRYSVELRADASYRLQEWTDRTDERVFLAALGVVQWKHANL
jgi:hypothetical protein